MKIELEQSDLIKIAEMVIEKLKPLITQNGNDQNNDELLDVKGVAEYLKVKESWVYDRTHTDNIPHEHAGKFPRFRKKQIDKWLENPYSLNQCAYKPLNKKGGDK